MVDGFRWRLRQTREHLAWHASNIMNAGGFLKRPISPNELMKAFGEGKPPAKKAERMTMSETREEFEKTRARVEAAFKEKGLE